jgi:hypothetical protein
VTELPRGDALVAAVQGPDFRRRDNTYDVSGSHGVVAALRPNQTFDVVGELLCGGRGLGGQLDARSKGRSQQPQDVQTEDERGWKHVRRYIAVASREHDGRLPDGILAEYNGPPAHDVVLVVPLGETLRCPVQGFDSGADSQATMAVRSLRCLNT